MPYKDPERKREWERTHRRARSEEYFKKAAYRRQDWSRIAEDRTPEGGPVSRYDLAALSEEQTESIAQAKRRLGLL